MTIWLDSAAQLRDIIAEHFAQTAGFQEIALHIDDQQRALRWDKLKRIWLGLDSHRFMHIHTSLPTSLIASPSISHVLRTETALFLQSKGKFCAMSMPIGYDRCCGSA